MHEFDKVEVPLEARGLFFTGDSYVILYKYRVELKGKDQHLVYFWQGAESTRVRVFRGAMMAAMGRYDVYNCCHCICRKYLNGI